MGLSALSCGSCTAPLNLPPDDVRHIIDSFRAKAKAGRRAGGNITADRYERQADEYEQAQLPNETKNHSDKLHTWLKARELDDAVQIEAGAGDWAVP
jgi:hypothetical protein